MVKRVSKNSKANKQEPPKEEKKRERIKISPKAKAWARVKSRVQAHDAQRAQGASINPFQLQPVPPNVLPPDMKPTMAMDDAINAQNTWAGNNKTAFFGGLAYVSAYQEGLAFPGYPYLTELAQRPEYRRFAETLAMEMTRKWIKVSAVDDDDDTKQSIINGINDELDRLQVRDMFRQCIEMDSFFGRAHLYIDTGQTNNREELKKSIGNGRDKLSQLKVTKGSLRRLKSVEPVWTYPTNYDSIDPLTDQWYEPDTWFVMGKEVHKTRLLKFVGREVPDLLKPAYSFGGLSMSQMAMPYVNNWLRTRQSVADIIHAFSVFVLATDMSQTMQEGDDLFERVDFFNFVRDNKGTMLIDKDSEEFQNVSASLASLDALQAQTQEHMASVSGIPIVKLLGIQPAGLNASSEGELRSFFDWVAAMQEKMLRPHLTTIIDMCMLNLYGKVDDSITFNFEPLWSLDEKGMAEVRSIEAETGVKLIESGVISQEEERKRVAADPESEYSSIEVDDPPNLVDEEQQGLEPKSGAVHIAEGAEGQSEKGVRGKEGIPDPKGHETGAGMADGEDKEPPQLEKQPYFQGQLRPDYLQGKRARLLHRYLNGSDILEGAELQKKFLNSKFLQELIAHHEDEGVDQSSLDINAGEGTGGRTERDTSIGSPYLDTDFLRQRIEEANAANPDRFEDDDQRGSPHSRELAMRALDLLRRKLDAQEVKGRNIRTARGGQVHLQTGGLGNRTAGGLRREAEKARAARLGNENDEVGRWDNWSEGESELGQDSFDWEEHAHPRDKGGKFTSGGGGGGGGSKENPKQTATPKPTFYGGKPKLNKSDLTKVGGQLGSNEGGKFEDAQGNKFYVKKGKSKEHVSNEYLAADLFKMSGFRTQKYRDVEGGDDIATEWENYDKNNAKDFTAEEKKEAQKLFATHAWLANWDAAGLDYDNQAMKNGKAVALDLGGALEYRAQGAPKGDKFGNKTGEWDSMRDSKVNPQNAQLFKGMSKDDLLQSALKVALIPDDDIKKAVKKRGKSSELADKLIERKRDLEHKANGDPQDASNPVTFFNDQELPVKELNGIPFQEWKPPSDWSSLEDVELDGDEEIDTTPTGGGKRKRAATGILMRESDGRLWLMRPKNRFGDYDQTVPKGGVEDGLSYQQNAIKEVWEETGLKAKITGIAGDIEGDTSVTRYYIGERETGDPGMGSWESSATVLVPPEKASQYLNRSRDRKVVDMAGDEFVESQHPRDSNGQFSKYQHTIGLSGQGESGKAVKKLFEDLGFEKGKSSSGKHKYTSKNLDVVVVEPPKGSKPNPKAKEGATPWSSVWTLYPNKEGDIIKGKGNKDLQAHLEKLKSAGVNVNAKKDEKKVTEKVEAPVEKDITDGDVWETLEGPGGKAVISLEPEGFVINHNGKELPEKYNSMHEAKQKAMELSEPEHDSDDEPSQGKKETQEEWGGEFHGVEGTANYVQNNDGTYSVGLYKENEKGSLVQHGNWYDVDTLENAKDIGNALAKGFLKSDQKIEKKPDGTYGAPNAGKVEIKGVGTEKSNSPANFGSALETVQEYENKADGIYSKVLKKDGKFVGVLIDTDDDKVVGSKAFDTEDEAKAYAKDFVGEEAKEKRRTAQPEPPKGQKQAKQEEPPKGQKGPSAEEVLKQKPDFHKTLTEHGYSNPKVEGEGKNKGVVLEKEGGGKIKLANDPSGSGEIMWLSKPNPPHIQKQGKGIEGLKKILGGNVDKNLMQNVPNAEMEHWPHGDPAQAEKQAAQKAEQEKAQAAYKEQQQAAQKQAKGQKGVLDSLKANRPTPTAKQKSAIQSYSGSAYAHINEKLRHGDEGIKPNTSEDHIQSYLNTCSTDHDCTVYRKVSGDYAKILSSIVEEGTVFKDKGFMSTSPTPGTWSGSMQMVITVKKGAKGTPINDWSSHQSENEILFAAGSRMRVHKIEGKESGFPHGRLHVELLNG